MPRRSRSYLTPVEWLAPNGIWPDGPFVAGTPEIISYATHWADALSRALEGVNKSALCLEVGMKRDTLYQLLNGQSWGDTLTLARLETTLGCQLWPPEIPPPPRIEER